MYGTKKIGALLLGVFLTTAATIAAEEDQKSSFAVVVTRVSDIISNASEIPGLKSAELQELRPEILKTWNALVKEGVLEITGTDQVFRPLFVTIQAVVEHVIAAEMHNEIRSVRGIIHTPMPATPLCTRGEISKDLVAKNINDPARLFTVTARPEIVRNLLRKGGGLMIAYPQAGFLQRTEEQRKIYQEALTEYPQRLTDFPLNCDQIPTELIGATYIFESNAGQRYAFSIKMTQAKDPKEAGHFGLWFGPLHHTAINQRVQAVNEFIDQNR